MRGARRGYIILWSFFAVLYVSCAADTSVLKDGFYSAQAAEFDTFGWKEYVSLRISGGRIIVVEYDSFTSSGFIKSWDMNYMRTMNALNGTYPNAYTRFYAGQLLKYQDTRKVDMLTGATTSYHAFIRLVEAAMESARHGFNETRMVDLNRQR
ncbi:MAG: FMN-binding protein [Treponema sp.]|jgi:major membrane immunogen (membrane-anchored lipoprotein)|nr:FMN-binding protein [Treponema sp.]